MSKRMSQIYMFPVRVIKRFFTALKLTTGDMLLLESAGTDKLLSEN